MKGACMEMDKYDVFIIGNGPVVIPLFCIP